MSLKFPEISFKPFLDEGGISLLPVTFQRLWRMASQQCQLALLSALWCILSGPIDLQGSGSWSSSHTHWGWVCVCSNLDFCSQGLGPNSGGRDRSDESTHNLFSIAGSYFSSDWQKPSWASLAQKAASSSCLFLADLSALPCFVPGFGNPHVHLYLALSHRTEHWHSCTDSCG